MEEATRMNAREESVRKAEAQLQQFRRMAMANQESSTNWGANSANLGANSENLVANGANLGASLVNFGYPPPNSPVSSSHFPSPMSYHYEAPSPMSTNYGGQPINNWGAHSFMSSQGRNWDREIADRNSRFGDLESELDTERRTADKCSYSSVNLAMTGSTRLDSTIDAILSKMTALTEKLKTGVEKFAAGVEKLQAISERPVEMRLESYPRNQMLNSTLQEETETEVSMEVPSQEFDSSPHIFDQEFEAEEAKAEASIDETSQELHSNPQMIEGFGKQEECCESLVSNSEETEELSQENDLNSQSLKVIPQIPSFTKNSILEVATKEKFELDEVSIDRSAHQVFVELSDKGVHLVSALVDWKFLSKIDNTELISSLKGSRSYPITFDPGGVFGLATPTVKNFPSCGQEIDPLVEIEDVKWCMSSGMVLEMDDSCSQPPNLFLEIASFCTKLNKYTSRASTDAQELEFNKLDGAVCHRFGYTRQDSILLSCDREKVVSLPCYWDEEINCWIIIFKLCDVLILVFDPGISEWGILSIQCSISIK